MHGQLECEDTRAKEGPRDGYADVKHNWDR